MATVAIMLRWCSSECNYFCWWFSSSGDDSLAEKKRHDKALVKYQKDYAKYEENRKKILDWQEQNRENKETAEKIFQDTDEAFKLYNRTHQDKIDKNEPVFSDYLLQTLKRSEVL